jgi:hypothetical protein
MMRIKSLSTVMVSIVMLASLSYPAWADTPSNTPARSYFWVVLETLGSKPDPFPERPFVVNVSQTGDEAEVRFEQYIFEKPGEDPQIKVLDTLKMRLKPGQRLDGASCEVRGIPDPEIMFLTHRNSQSRTLSPAETTAWRTNRQTGKFERIQFDRRNTFCRNRFFGT